jgi:hypothetical protein
LLPDFAPIQQFPVILGYKNVNFQRFSDLKTNGENALTEPKSNALTPEKGCLKGICKAHSKPWREKPGIAVQGKRG